ncbi:MAG TPA: EVE domain-containing protein, partial [Synergistaceae bacterium]|nr:EVE domain-containing protein [Synergistaceae bacterium]
MSDTISAEQINRFRKEFREYLRQSHPEWKESTVSTVASDAFFALNNNVGVDFWESLESENSLRIVSHAIRSYLEKSTDFTKARERAEGYLSALGYLKTFIDEKHPALPQDWKGKSISQENLRKDFEAWMKKQKKDSGQAYSKNTINTYAGALRSTTAKLDLEEPLQGNLFTYTSLDDFLRAYAIIQRAPNLKEVEAAAGNKAYSRGMVLYKGFLEELEQPSAWIFQGNPKYYDVLGAVENLEELVWAVNQYHKRIKKGDKAYIWISGPEGGIVASGQILCNPELRKPNEKDSYLRGEPLKTEPYRAVDIRILRRFPPQKITRTQLLADERTKELEILTYPGATNFPVTKAQEEVIESMLSGSYEPVPVKNDDE